MQQLGYFSKERPLMFTLYLHEDTKILVSDRKVLIAQWDNKCEQLELRPTAMTKMEPKNLWRSIRKDDGIKQESALVLTPSTR